MNSLGLGLHSCRGVLAQLTQVIVHWNELRSQPPQIIQSRAGISLSQGMQPLEKLVHFVFDSLDTPLLLDWIARAVHWLAEAGNWNISFSKQSIEAGASQLAVAWTVKGSSGPARNGLKTLLTLWPNALVLFRAKMVTGQEHVLRIYGYTWLLMSPWSSGMGGHSTQFCPKLRTPYQWRSSPIMVTPEVKCSRK